MRTVPSMLDGKITRMTFPPMNHLFQRRHCLWLLAVSGLPHQALASQEAPDAFIRRITTDTLETIKSDKALRNGDMARIMQLVDGQLMQRIPKSYHASMGVKGTPFLFNVGYHTECTWRPIRITSIVGRESSKQL